MTCSISTDDNAWISQMKDTIFMEKPFSPSRLIEQIDEYFEAKES